MLGRLLRIGILMLLTVLSPRAIAAAGKQFISVGTSTHGEVWWYGHLIKGPPYVIEIGYTPAQDTVWHGVYINRKPMIPVWRYPDKPKQAGSKGGKFQVIAHVDSVVTERRKKKEQSRKSVSTKEILDWQAEEYRRSTTMVDSVAEVSDREMIVYWHGGIAEHFTIAPHPSGSSISPSQARLTAATAVLETLRMNYLILITIGSQLSISPAHRALYESYIDEVRHGHPSSQASAELHGFIEDLRSPAPEDSILRGAP